MALETISNMGFGPYVKVNHDTNEITFKIQNGPIKEVGENGCQVDMMVYISRCIISGLNQKFPCRENSCAITKLDEAGHWLDARTKDREVRGVEGLDKE